MRVELSVRRRMSRAESNCVCAVGISFGLLLSFFTQCNIYHSLSSAEILPRNARHFAYAKFDSSGDSLRSLPHPLRMTRRGVLVKEQSLKHHPQINPNLTKSSIFLQLAFIRVIKYHSLKIKTRHNRWVNLYLIAKYQLADFPVLLSFACSLIAKY